MAKRDRNRLDPDDVLRGRLRPDAVALSTLVRAVNPSGEDLPAAERARRYALKSRLQSVLVRSFGDELDIVSDPAAGEGFVLLRHRPSGSLACHALVAELDDDARSWVQHQLDLDLDGRAADPVPRPRPSASRREARPRSPAPAGAPGDADTVDELLRAAQQAGDDYDYDLARSFFSRALERSGGAAAAATGLLDLLVEQLGADADALALTGSFAPAALAEPRVRRHLALAAARTGDRENALSFVKGQRDPGTAAVFAALAKEALGAGDPAAAARDLREARDRDPSYPDLAGLDAAVAAARAAARKPLEDRVLGLVAAGHVDEAEAAARELSADETVSPALRKALRLIDEHKRRTHAAQLAAEAERAFAAGQLQTAIGLLRQSLLEHPESETGRAAQLLAEAESAERARAEATAAEAVAKLLAAPDPAEGLVAYVAQPPAVRTRVRELSPRRELDRLDATGISGTGARARAAVAAVFALDRAEQIVADDPSAAIDLLRAQGKLLDGVPGAQSTQQRAEALLVERQRSEARRRFEAARALLAAHGFSGSGSHVASAPAEGQPAAVNEADKLLSDATLRHLDPPERAQATALRAEIAKALAYRKLGNHLLGLAIKGNVVEARSQLEAEIAKEALDTSEREARSLDAMRSTLDGWIQRSFEVCLAGEGARDLEPRKLGRAVLTDRALPMPDLWGVSLERMTRAEPCVRHGRELVLVQSRGRFVFVRVVDFTQKPPLLRQMTVLRTPQPLALGAARATPSRLTAVGSFGAVLHLSLPDCRVLAWRPPLEPPARFGAMSTFALPWLVPQMAIDADARLVWLVDEPAEPWQRLSILDAETLHLVREERVEGRRIQLDLTGASGGADIAVRDERPAGMEFRRRTGEALEGGRFGLEVYPGSCAPYPGGGVFAVARENAAADFGAVRLVPGEAAPVPQPLDDLSDGALKGVAADLAGGRVFFLHDTDEHQRFLFAFAAGADGTVTRLYRVRVPHRSVLVVDTETSTPRLLALLRGAFHVATLGPEPPDLPEDPEPLQLVVVPRIRLFATDCHESASRDPEAVEEAARALRRAPFERPQRIAAAMRRNAADEMYDLARALEKVGAPAEAANLDNHALRRHPTHPWHILGGVRGHANMGLWKQVYDGLHDVDLTALTSPAVRHYMHLMGLALLDAGQHEAAHPLLVKGLQHPGSCELDALVAVAAPPGDTAEVPPAQKPMRALLRRVAEADLCLAAADHEGAIALLDDVLVWEAREIQSMARLASAMLDAGDDHDADRLLRKLFVLATFLELHDDQGSRRRELFLRGRWSAAHLARIAEASGKWLEAFVKG